MADRIDVLDENILKILSVNARVPLKEVAEACDVSRAAVHQRMMRLFEDGAVSSRGFQVNPRKLGYNTCTFVGLRLERGSMYKRVMTELYEIAEIVECHYTTGPYTLLIKLYARDNEHLMELLNGRVQQIEGVVSTETLISLEQSFSRQVPIEGTGRKRGEH